MENKSTSRVSLRQITEWVKELQVANLWSIGSMHLRLSSGSTTFFCFINFSDVHITSTRCVKVSKSAERCGKASSAMLCNVKKWSFLTPLEPHFDRADVDECGYYFRLPELCSLVDIKMQNRLLITLRIILCI